MQQQYPSVAPRPSGASAAKCFQALSHSFAAFSLSDGWQASGCPPSWRGGDEAPLGALLGAPLAAPLGPPLGATDGARGGLVLSTLEALLVKGLNVFVGFEPFQDEAEGLLEAAPCRAQFGGALLYLPLVRHEGGPSKLRVCLQAERTEPCGGPDLEVAVSKSTVSFNAILSNGDAPLFRLQEAHAVGTRQQLTQVQRAAGGTAAAGAASGAAAGAACCIVRLVCCCGSVLSFSVDRGSPVETQRLVVGLRLRRVALVSLHEALRATVKRGPFASYFGGLLSRLPLFALGPPAPQPRLGFAASEEAQAAAAAARAAEAAATGLDAQDYCFWPGWNAGELSPSWAVAVACRWLVLIANHHSSVKAETRQRLLLLRQRLQEDGVRERHTLLTAFRRLLLGLRARYSSLQPAETESPTDASSFFLDTTVPSDVTVAIFFSSRSEEDKINSGAPLTRCPSACGRRGRALNPNAAPFVPRVFSLPAEAPCWISCGEALCGAPCEPSESSTSPASLANSAEREPPTCPAVKEGGPTNRGPQPGSSPLTLSRGPPARELPQLKKSASASCLRGPQAGSQEIVGGPLRVPHATEDRVDPQLTKGNSSLGRPHSAPAARQEAAAETAAPAATAAAAAAVAAAAHRYSVEALLALRRHSLLLQPARGGVGFSSQQIGDSVQQQQQQQPPLLPHSAAAMALATAAAACGAAAAAPPSLLPVPSAFQRNHLRLSGEAFFPQGISSQQQQDDPVLQQQRLPHALEQRGEPLRRPLFPVGVPPPGSPPLLPTPCGPRLSAVSFQQQRQSERDSSPALWGPRAAAYGEYPGGFQRGPSLPVAGPFANPANGSVGAPPRPVGGPLAYRSALHLQRLLNSAARPQWLLPLQQQHPQQQLQQLLPTQPPQHSQQPLQFLLPQQQQQQLQQAQPQQPHQQQLQQRQGPTEVSLELQSSPHRSPLSKANKKARGKRGARACPKPGRQKQRQQQQQENSKLEGASGSRSSSTQWPSGHPSGVAVQQLLELVRALLLSSRAAREKQQQPQQNRQEQQQPFTS
ncbi:hypothetical protein Efla_004310 [Eimeria flavescens]